MTYGTSMGMDGYVLRQVQEILLAGNNGLMVQNV